MQTITLSVRELVESVLKCGDIDTGSIVSANRAVLGTWAHKKVQQMMEDDYAKEVPLSYSCDYRGNQYKLDGRADGIIHNLMGVTVDEIKSTYKPLDQIGADYNPIHWAQAKCYAHILAQQNQLQAISVRLTYYNLTTQKLKHFTKHYTTKELAVFFEDLLEKHDYWIRWQQAWTIKRNVSLEAYTFPFTKYRKGQRALAGTIYKHILAGEKLYVNAPTGTGKTISTLFPTLKAMGEGYITKIFYLTAKTITRTVAEETLAMMHASGATYKAITLTAKDKLCPYKERNCTPEVCRFAKGHFDRIDEAVRESLEACDLFTREQIIYYAEKYTVCPFEYALDIALYTDIVICDYNHVFDPTASLKRFMDDKGFVYLVDEAHNLVDRARSMFSAKVDREMLTRAKKALPKMHQSLRNTLLDIEGYLKQLQKVAIQTHTPYISKEQPTELKRLVRKYIEAVDEVLAKGIGEFASDFIDFYFEAQQFVRIYELFDERYVQYIEGTGTQSTLHLYCLDPSYLISERLSTCQSSIFFSATLMPIGYYQAMLGGVLSDAVFLESIFQPEQSKVLLVTDVSTKYQQRTTSYEQVVEAIQALVRQKKGNYLIFFPSYQYMMSIYERYPRTEENIIIQQTHMDEDAREAFLAQFKEKITQTTIGFCVLGGIFSEGIDLRGNRVIGVGVVGVGLPQLGIQRDLIKHYFEDNHQEGYHYAYTYPGINKVLQAMGRLIRTEKDLGVVVLIDTRYHTAFYKQLLGHTLSNSKEIQLSDLKEEVRTFWKERS